MIGVEGIPQRLHARILCTGWLDVHRHPPSRCYLISFMTAWRDLGELQFEVNWMIFEVSSRVTAQVGISTGKAAMEQWGLHSLGIK